MMDNYRAAVLVVEMVVDLRASGYDRDEYHEAATLAVSALMRDYEKGDPNEPEAGEAAASERAH